MKSIVLTVLTVLIFPLIAYLSRKKIISISLSPSSKKKEVEGGRESLEVFTEENYLEKDDKEKLKTHIGAARSAITAMEVIAERIKIGDEHNQKEDTPCPKPIEPKEWAFDVFVDAGHGTLLNGVHTTIAGMGRYWTHSKGEFHKGQTFYEGVSNRVLAEKYISRIEALGMNIVRTYSYLDMGLSHRVAIANYHHKHIQKGFLLSFHSNATVNHNARGFQYFTTVGDTSSDPLAQKIWEETKDFFPDMMLSQDYVDGDADYEKNFTIITDTICPAVLLENLFFDQYDDALMLMDEDVQDRIVEALVNATIWAQENLPQE